MRLVAVNTSHEVNGCRCRYMILSPCACYVLTLSIRNSVVFYFVSGHTAQQVLILAFCPPSQCEVQQTRTIISLFKTEPSQRFGSTMHTCKSSLLFSLFSLSLTLTAASSPSDLSTLHPRGLGSSKPSAPLGEVGPTDALLPHHRASSGIIGSLHAKEGKIGCGGPEGNLCMRNCYCDLDGDVVCDRKLAKDRKLGEWMKSYHIRSLTSMCGPVCSCVVDGEVKYGGLSRSELRKLRHDHRWLREQMEVQEHERLEAKAAKEAAKEAAKRRRRGGGDGGGSSAG